MKSFNCLQHVFVFLGQVDTVPTTGTCMRGDGRGYRGTVAVTQSGVPCQSWNSQSPHQHPMAPGLFISDLDDRYNPHHGYCRNPGGLGRQPWCYTTKTTLRWEYCNITKCGECGLFFDIMSVWSCSGNVSLWGGRLCGLDSVLIQVCTLGHTCLDSSNYCL